ncbi:hypothetical protein GCM10010336_51150 [Streptomyces goshikiensis]|nr:hypothetical protein GCM10010336_51150 [Streptomyces goshikiensis]
MGVDEGDARLVHELAPDGAEKPHALDGLDALPPQIDLGPGRPQRRKAFGNGHLVAAPGKPERQGLPRDSTTGDENPQGLLTPSLRHAHSPKSISERFLSRVIYQR